MAGIGFSLERMAGESSLASVSGAYVHATFLVAGPWILTALTIAGISAFAPAPQGVIQDFRTLLIYNFLFSILLASPIALPATRFASDEIYARRFESMQSALVVALLLFALVGFGTIAPLYALGLSGPLALAAVHAMAVSSGRSVERIMAELRCARGRQSRRTRSRRAHEV
jgi:uncharacterized membrane protein